MTYTCAARMLSRVRRGHTCASKSETSVSSNCFVTRAQLRAHCQHDVGRGTVRQLWAGQLQCGQTGVGGLHQLAGQRRRQAQHCETRDCACVSNCCSTACQCHCAGRWITNDGHSVARGALATFEAVQKHRNTMLEKQTEFVVSDYVSPLVAYLSHESTKENGSVFEVFSCCCLFR